MKNSSETETNKPNLLASDMIPRPCLDPSNLPYACMSSSDSILPYYIYTSPKARHNYFFAHALI
jgi:hypothetical protein